MVFNGGRVKEGEFREWSFPIEEVIDGVKRFLKDVGYDLLTTEYVGFVKPDFHARRRENNNVYEIIGIGSQHTDTAVEALIKLAAIRAFLGSKVDYVLVMPPINEHLLLEFLRGEEGTWYLAMKDLQMMLWLANPEQEYTWCLVGEPLDKLFRGFFVPGKVSLDFMLMQELSRQRWEEEE